MNELPKLKVQIIDEEVFRGRGCRTPQYHSSGASGLDLCAYLGGTLYLKSGERTLIPTGIKLEIPLGYEGQIRSRSGAALCGLVVCNAPGTIDSDYRGEVHVYVQNISRREFQDEPDTITIKPGDRIAQLVITPVARVAISVTRRLPPTPRGEQGFGSTGGFRYGEVGLDDDDGGGPEPDNP